MDACHFTFIDSAQNLPDKLKLHQNSLVGWVVKHTSYLIAVTQSNTEKHSKMQSELELARAAMIAKRFGGNVTGASTGGEGTVRRKKKGAHKSLGG